MGDSSETVFQGQLFLRNCTCPKPECTELEIEMNPPAGTKTVLRLSLSEAKDLQWFLTSWLNSKAAASV